MNRWRRTTIAAGTAAWVIGLGLAPFLTPSSTRAAAPRLVTSATSGGGTSHLPRTPIHHFIVLLQENHTFDNYFGTYPGADGLPPGVCVPVHPDQGKRPCVRPFHLGNRAIVDPDHSQQSARQDLAGGLMNGFVAAQNLRSINGDQVMGYYDGHDLPFYWNMADRYVLFDHFFSSALGGSFANHVYWVAATSGGQSIPVSGMKITTIFDRLQQARLSWKFYVQNYDPKINYRTLRGLNNPNRASQAVWVPLLDIPRFLKNPALRSHIVDLSHYYRDLRDGTLPDVAYVVPSGASEHPPGSLATGQRFVRGLVNALMASRAWDSSAFMMAYDDWGGWYDHVPPPRRDAYGDGFRVPALLVSAYARQHYIDHASLDFTSMLRFIEQNWRLRPLTTIDATAGSLMGAFNFSRAPREPDIIPVVRLKPALPDSSARDPLLYGLYGIGLSFAVVAIIAAARSAPRRRRLSLVRSGGETA